MTIKEKALELANIIIAQNLPYKEGKEIMIKAGWKEEDRFEIPLNDFIEKKAIELKEQIEKEIK